MSWQDTATCRVGDRSNMEQPAGLQTPGFGRHGKNLRQFIPFNLLIKLCQLNRGLQEPSIAFFWSAAWCCCDVGAYAGFIADYVLVIKCIFFEYAWLYAFMCAGLGCHQLYYGPFQELMPINQWPRLWLGFGCGPPCDLEGVFVAQLVCWASWWEAFVKNQWLNHLWGKWIVKLQIWKRIPELKSRKKCCDSTLWTRKRGYINMVNNTAHLRPRMAQFSWGTAWRSIRSCFTLRWGAIIRPSQMRST